MLRLPSLCPQKYYFSLSFTALTIGWMFWFRVRYLNMMSDRTLSVCTSPPLPALKSISESGGCTLSRLRPLHLRYTPDRTRKSDVNSVTKTLLSWSQLHRTFPRFWQRMLRVTRGTHFGPTHAKNRNRLPYLSGDPFCAFGTIWAEETVGQDWSASANSDNGLMTYAGSNGLFMNNNQGMISCPHMETEFMALFVVWFFSLLFPLHQLS